MKREIEVKFQEIQESIEKHKFELLLKLKNDTQEQMNAFVKQKCLIETTQMKMSQYQESMRQSLSTENLDQVKQKVTSIVKGMKQDIKLAASLKCVLVYSKPSINIHHDARSQGEISIIVIEELSRPLLTYNEVRRPWGIAINKEGEITVSDNEADSLRFFTSTGKSIPDKTLKLTCYYHRGCILVADRKHHCVKIF